MLNDIPDTVELYDIVDSLDPLLTICVELFRAGKAGEGCVSFRVGNGGGPRRAGRGGVLALFAGWSRSTPGGGRRAVPFGWLLGCFADDAPYVGTGGLFVVWPLEGSAGRFEDEDVGRGGGGRFAAGFGAPPLLLTACLFKAAMRAESDVNWGSSTSAIGYRWVRTCVSS